MTNDNNPCPFLADYDRMVDVCMITLKAMYLLTLKVPEDADINAATAQRYVALAAHAGNVSLCKVLIDVNARVKEGRQPHQDVMNWVQQVADDITIDPTVGRA